VFCSLEASRHACARPCSFGFVAFEHAASADALKSMRTIDFFGKTARARAPLRQTKAACR
jgi:hypothetical protein